MKNQIVELRGYLWRFGENSIDEETGSMFEKLYQILSDSDIYWKMEWKMSTFGWKFNIKRSNIAWPFTILTNVLLTIFVSNESDMEVWKVKSIILW